MLIPKDVRHVFKATHFRRSTRHRDLTQAQIVGLPWVAEWKQKISRARMEPDTIMADIAKAKATVPEGTDARTGVSSLISCHPNGRRPSPLLNRRWDLI